MKIKVQQKLNNLKFKQKKHMTYLIN